MINIFIPTNLSEKDKYNFENKLFIDSNKTLNNPKFRYHIYLNNLADDSYNINKFKKFNNIYIKNVGKSNNIGELRNRIIDDFLNHSDTIDKLDYLTFLDGDDYYDIESVDFELGKPYYVMNRKCEQYDNIYTDIKSFEDYCYKPSYFLFCTGYLFSAKFLRELVSKYGNKLFLERKYIEEYFIMPIIASKYTDIFKNTIPIIYHNALFDYGLGRSCYRSVSNTIRLFYEDTKRLEPILSKSDLVAISTKWKYDLGRNMLKFHTLDFENEVEMLSNIMNENMKVRGNTDRLTIIITGNGGTGKSTLMSELSNKFHTMKLSVGYLPSVMMNIRSELPESDYNKFVPSIEFLSLYDFIDRYPELDKAIYEGNFDKLRNIVDRLKSIPTHTFLLYIKLSPVFEDHSNKDRPNSNNYEKAIDVLNALKMPMIINRDYKYEVLNYAKSGILS